jgi:hypothetical protein
LPPTYQLFYDGDRPLRARDMTDRYPSGLFVIAGATSRAERAWLREVLGTDTHADA